MGVIGFFTKKEKKYTLAKAIKKLQKPGFEHCIPVPIDSTSSNTKYWIRTDGNFLKQVSQVRTPFQEKRRKMMEEIGVGEDYRNRVDNVIRSNSLKPGKVIYNNYQSAKNYQKSYGQR